MELKDLYRDVILDHNRQPRNFGRIEGTDAQADGYNPLCGDRLTVFVRLNGEQVEDIRFEGKGCAISTASASLMTEAVKGKDRAAIQNAVRQGARAAHAAGRGGRCVARQARRALGRARVPGAREVREPVLAHAQRGARARRGHRFHRMTGAPRCADRKTNPLSSTARCAR